LRNSFTLLWIGTANHQYLYSSIDKSYDWGKDRS